MMKHACTCAHRARTLLRAAALAAAVLVLLGPSWAAGADAKKFPRPAAAVNDFAGIIPPDVKARTEALCAEILQKTGASVVVATMPDIHGEDPDMYANELYASWGIGKKGEDRGVLIFVAVKERRVRIETGYGVEGILPDGLVGSILDEQVRPSLKAGDYGQGLFNAVLSVGTVIAKDAGVTIGEGYQLKRPVQRRQAQGSGWGLVILAGLMFLVAMTPMGRALLMALFLNSLMGGRGGYSSGGGFGSFGGGFDGFGGGSSGGGGAGRDF